MKITMLICSIMAIFALSNCANHTAAPPPKTETTVVQAAVYQKISAKEAKQMMDEGGDFILLDVRTAEEFAEKRIAGAILIPDFEIAARAAAELTDKDARILVYCRSGRRSALAAQALADLGYTNVYDFGGITSWPYETVSGEESKED